MVIYDLIELQLLNQMKSLGRYFGNLFNNHLPNERVRKEAYEEITISLNRAFALPSLREYSRSLSLKGLMVKAVEMFVGSRAMPKNIGLSRELIDMAEGKVKNGKELSEIEYYKILFLENRRVQERKDCRVRPVNRNAESFGGGEGTPSIMCRTGNIKYLVGKQLLSVAQSTSVVEERKKMIKLAAHYFQKSLNDHQYGGLYFLGEILSNDQYSHMTGEEVKEFFVYGAALGDPMCYFRISQIKLAEGNNKLYVKYLKLAAESGIIEAQHNLGCEYLDGLRLKKDEVKALAWFLHAGANGFIQSKYNIVYMFLNGSQCGRIKKNKKVALLKLQELKHMGEQVQDKIKQLVQSEELKQQVPQKYQIK